MNIKFNVKGVIYGVLALILIVGGFIFIPNMFMDKSKPVDYTMVQREAIPEKILSIMDKYTDQERALAVKLDGKIYIVVTRGNDNKHGIEIEKISTLTEDEKEVMKVNIVYKNKEKSYPYIVLETNLNKLPDRIELSSRVEDK
ncbi:hypothetical protein CHL78_015025 [Romboutsia weinsteinii]|uniref:Uncharacterized protein n=1 Tax=Romboutsia weinsteinii TaxID=2020949 RepID=A0A371J093_9FIRM|nr:hypothetical protein [Romboutsia weinsteinii]RDY26114.1 hypothetical protein CHL78_015025 [Romboutsia weinsteinii]